MITVEAIQYGLTFHTAEAWHDTVGLIRTDLDRERRMALAIAALAACEPDDVAEIVSEIAGGAGSPVPPFDAVMSDAMFWADLASRNELKAYAVATFLRMHPRDQATFLAWTDQRAAA